ncbi:MAG: DNA starvation/stationary phase protection protein Dps [Verrucomicrobiales bacterium]|nr:DNA starvation/stationary phase protection protein Dps [Verrucomicrobiales bacterium]
MARTKLNPTGNSVPAKSRGPLVDLLNQTLADLSDLYSQAKQAHWNVRGEGFYSLHKLFDDVAASVEGHLDDLAERAVQLGGIARGTVRMAAGASQLKEWPAADLSQPGAVLVALTERFAAAATLVRDALDEADQLGDADTADLLTAVSRDLDKSLWFLEASR